MKCTKTFGPSISSKILLAQLLQGFSGAVHYAELQTTMQAAHNSSACIADSSCLPLGGHSVWCVAVSEICH